MSSSPAPGAASKSHWLVVGDVDQVQAFVFASTRLRAIRGASALLETAVNHFREREESSGRGIHFLRCTGGQVVAEVPGQDEAVAFQTRLEAAVCTASAGMANITTARVLCDTDQFRTHLGKAFHDIRAEKDGRQGEGKEGAALLSSPYYHRCNLLPGQPASRFQLIGEAPDEAEDEEPEGRYLSEAALKRWEAVKAIHFDTQLLDRLRQQDKDFAAVREEVKLPYDLEDLWETDEGGYMALVAADGNSIGQMLEVINDAQIYENFSRELYELTLDAIAQAISQAGLARPFTRKKRKREGQVKRYYLPVIPVVVAGDDMSLLVRAQDAVPFAEFLCRAFAQRSQQGQYIQQVVEEFCQDASYRAAANQLYPNWPAGKPRPLTLSLGLAIAKRNFPISAYRRLADELKVAAKARLRQEPQVATQGGVIDFAVITAATVPALEELRARYAADEGRTLLTERPYTLDRFAQLQQLAESLQRVPRSKRKFLYQQLFRGRVAGREAFEFVIGRQRGREPVDRAMQSLGYPARSAFRPRDPVGMEQSTCLPDALELVELIEMREER